MYGFGGGTSLVAQLVKNLLAMWETWVWSLGWEDPLEEGLATHSSILAWRIPWTVTVHGVRLGGRRCSVGAGTQTFSSLYSMTTLKPLTVWITTSGKFWKRWEYQTTLPASWETCMQVKKQQLELDLEQQSGSKLGKEYIKAVYWHLVYLTYMQSTSGEMPDWMKHKLESRLPGEISVTSDMQITPPLWQKAKRN